MNAVLKPEPVMPTGYYQTRDRLAPALRGVKAVLPAESHHPFVTERPKPNGGIERGFKLKLHETRPDAPLSPIYLNLRTPDNPKSGPLTQEIVGLAASCMVYIKLAHKLPCHAVVGVPRAGDPFAAAFAQFTGVKRIELDKFEQGEKRHIAGVKGLHSVSKEVQDVLLLDDLLTGADSKIEAVLNLRESGFTVTDAIVLVDREQGGVEALAKHDVIVHSVFTMSELLDGYVANGSMTPYMRTKVQQYLAETA